jgi:glutathione S-transferase
MGRAQPPAAWFQCAHPAPERVRADASSALAGLHTICDRARRGQGPARFHAGIQRGVETSSKPKQDRRRVHRMAAFEEAGSGDSMITLYHSPNSRSASIVWLLEELCAPYETRIVTFRHADGTGARDPANPHPHGKVPALRDGDDTLFETSAIALYLTDKYPAGKMGPRAGEPKRAEYLSWLAYRPGVMEPALIARRFGIAHVHGAMGWAPAEEVEEVLNAHLSSSDYFLGDQFSAVDILLGGGLHFMMMAKMIAETPVLTAYSARVTDRPAFRRMMERDANG